ncbi:MAG: response regulator transcription factor [Brachymonas sp.]|nr:response regulator transcription factor [Brachymonas sp.]
MRVLLLEDDELLGSGLRDYLCAEGHVVDWCTRISQARELAVEPFDVWLIDWQLPDGSGLDWLQARRARGDHTVALMLTARGDLAHRITGLDSGADDYLAKPVKPEEIAARLRAIARRRAMPKSDQHSLGNVLVDCGARTARLQGQLVELTSREWAILEALVMRHGRMLTKTDIESLVVGGESSWSSNAAEVHISALRRKLGKASITTVRGLGYRWEGT